MEVPTREGAPGSPFVAHGGELRLSNRGQLSLLQGVTERGASLHTTVRGVSMTPLIRDGDAVTIAPLKGRSPRVGDVVAFVVPHSCRLAVHRVVAREGTGWLVRGDNCPEPDGVVTTDNILGRVVAVERTGRGVRFGRGAAGALVAALSRRGLLGWLRALTLVPRRLASFALRRAQGLAVYRSLGKHAALPFAIAEASGADLEEVHRLFGCQTPYRPSPPDPQVTNWVAKVDGRVAGFVQLTSRPETGSGWGGHWLFSLRVRPGLRGRGLGEGLTRQVIDRSTATGAPDLRLAVFEDNGPALALYAKLGFEPITVAVLEPGFLKEKGQTGRRRIVLCRRRGRNP